MSIPVICTGCETSMKVPDAAAGKLVKCPNCETRTKVPAPVAEQIDDDGEEEAPRPKKKLARQEIEDEELLRKKPRRLRDEEDEEEETPRRKKAPAKSGNNKVLFLVLAAVGGMVLLGGGIGAAWYFMKGSDLSKPVINSPEMAKPVVFVPKAEFNVEIAATNPNTNAYTNGLFLSPNGNNLLIRIANGPSQIWGIQTTPRLLSKVTSGEAVALVNEGKHVLVRPKSGKPYASDLITGEKIEGPIHGFWQNGDYGMCLSNVEGEFYWSPRHMNWKPTPFKITQRKPIGGDIVTEYSANSDSFVVYSPPVNGERELVFGDQKQNVVKCFDFEKKSITRQFALPRVLPGQIAEEWQSFASSADGKLIAVRRDYGNVEFVDQTGNFVGSLPDLFHTGLNPDRFIGRGHLFITTALPKGEQRNESTRGIFDVDKKSFVGVVRGPAGKFVRYSVSADGCTLVYYYSDRAACVFDLSQLK